MTNQEKIKSLQDYILKLQKENSTLRGTKFPDGIDWHIVGTQCFSCGESQTLPVADNAGEDIYLYELMGELRSEPCGCGSRNRKVFYEEGNMASKKKLAPNLSPTIA